VRNEVRRARGDFEDIVKEIDGGLTHLEWRETVVPVPRFTDTVGGVKTILGVNPRLGASLIVCARASSGRPTSTSRQLCLQTFKCTTSCLCQSPEISTISTISSIIISTISTISSTIVRGDRRSVCLPGEDGSRER